MDIYEALTREHAKIMKTLRKLEDSTSAQSDIRESLLEEVRERILSENGVKEENLYPILTTDPDTSKEVDLSREEDRVIEEILNQMKETPKGEKRFQYLSEQLNGRFQVHVEREEKELFPHAREVIPNEQAETLGRRAEEQL